MVSHIDLYTIIHEFENDWNYSNQKIQLLLVFIINSFTICYQYYKMHDGAKVDKF